MDGARTFFYFGGFQYKFKAVNFFITILILDV